MGKDPDAIRQEIEETRERMGETVEAIGYKADIPSRARDAIGEKVESVRDTVAAGASRVTGNVSGKVSRAADAAPGRQDVRRGGRRITTISTENPLGLAVGAAALGFLAGLLSPSTRLEDERVGPIADHVKEKAKETGDEALRRGQHVVTQAAQSAAETASQEGRTQGERLADSTRERARDVQESASDQRP
jgi:gas vesicle protein